jgi:hypothetical protein
MESERTIARLEAGPGLIRSLVAGVGREQAHWKPSPASWSVVEVINHLHDEEIDDFRMRLDLTLHHPGRDWPPIDPEGWCTERRYNERELGESLAAWRAEREASLAWLRSLQAPDWASVHRHPRLGELRAGDLLLSWATHDLLHARQLLGLHKAWIDAGSESYSGAYAGRW